jgi:NAD+ synthase (glutamine-hydrolysing)
MAKRGGTATSVRTRLAQLEVRPGCPAENTRRILDCVSEARQAGVELLVFSELAVPGYLLGDEWEHAAFLRECEACGELIRAAAQGITVVFGNVGIDWQRRNEDGRTRKYNALFVAEDGCFVGPEGSPYPFAIKTLLPNYRQFDDSRHFFDLRKLAAEEGRPVDTFLRPVRTRRLVLGCVLCEDAWDGDYTVAPLAVLARDSSIDLFINASASPFTMNKNHKRNRVFAEHARRLGRPLVYVNHVGIQNNGKTIYTFDGASCVYDGTGRHVRCGAPFEDTTLTLDIPLAPGAAFGARDGLETDSVAMLWQALVYGTQRFLAACGCERVVIGASGGVDSALVAAIHAHILPPEQLLLVNMPSRYNSATTRNLARALADGIGCLYADIPIEDSIALTERQVHKLEITDNRGILRRTLALSDLARENIQARDRSSRLLAALASAFGGVFSCNANKSEITVGYTTLYGDLGGYLAAIGDLWKTEVYDLARYVNTHLAGHDLIPAGSLTVPPSAELSAAQNVDAGKGDPLVYAYHDRLFASWVEWWNRITPEEILDWYRDGSLGRKIGYDGAIEALFPSAPAFVADLERWWKLYTGMGVAKRIQAPPILAVKRRAFGFDHRESQMGTHYTARYRACKASLLN